MPKGGQGEAELLANLAADDLPETALIRVDAERHHSLASPRAKMLATKCRTSPAQTSQ